MQKFFLSLIPIFFMTSIFAKDCGVIGTVYPIAEADLLVEMENRMAHMQTNGEWEKIQEQFNQTLQQHFDRPAPVENLIRTQKETTRWLDPTFTMPTDIKTPDGKLLIKAGTQLNPLKDGKFDQTLIFYDSDDKKQVDWVKQIQSKISGSLKLILVRGSVLEQMQLFNQRIYFDQGGKLTTRFGIRQVPAIVSSEKNQFKIEEVKP